MANTNSSKRTRRMAREPMARPAASAESGSAQDVAVREPADDAPSKGQSKMEEVLSLLERAEGATLDELVQATGWLPHTTRAALTGLRKKGHSIRRTKHDGISRYTVVEAAASR